MAREEELKLLGKLNIECGGTSGHAGLRNGVQNTEVDTPLGKEDKRFHCKFFEIIQSNWKYGLALLGAYGFFVEMKPSEPYLTPYLAVDKNFPKDVINNRIYPYWTYGELVAVFFVPFLAKFITPKRLLYLETLGFLATRALLIWGTSLPAMQFMQLTYAIGTSVKSVYYCYTYLVFEKKHFDTATGFIWGAQAFGGCVSGVLGQLLVNAGMSYLALNYISMTSVCIALFLALFVPEKKYESRIVATDSGDTSGRDNITSFAHGEQIPATLSTSDWRGYVDVVAAEYMQVFYLFRDSRGPMSFTWILTKCVEELVQNYASTLWYNLSDDSQSYGTVIALYQGFGVIGALFPVIVRVLVKDEGFQSTITRALQGMASVCFLASLIIMTVTDDIWVAYLAYIAAGFFYYVFITGVSCKIAEASQPSEQVLLFAANLFCAAMVSTIVTLVLSNIDAQPKMWFTAVCGIQGMTVPVYFYQSYYANKCSAQD
ncbi:hypothetical protein ACHAWF_012325 [Thalassiosira exigua]